MVAINQLTQTTAIAAGDLIPLWSQANGATQSAPVSLLTSYLESRIGARQLVTQYASPATGATVTVASGDDTWLIITPTATIAALTVALPAAAEDHQMVQVNSSQIITALTVTPGVGATVVGQPTAMTAQGFFTMRFDAVLSVWRRVA
jgi:hypothetical protein